MKSPVIQERARKFRAAGATHNRERGVTMILVAIAMIAIIAMAALSIDVITLYLAREEAQRAADASALAAARVISMSGLTGDTGNTSWGSVCGGASSPATLAAIAVGMQSSVGGTVATTTTVTYSGGGMSGTDCSGLPAAFGINPQVTVQVSRSSLPTFFSRIWGSTGNSVSATAVAEAYNPSNSGSVAGGVMVPVQPSCVKPWIVPNQDPVNPPLKGGNYCNNGTTGSCIPLVALADGSIQHPGITLFGYTNNNPPGIIGETFWLIPDCQYSGSVCTFATAGVTPITPQANFANSTIPAQPPGPNLAYVPGQTLNASTAVPSCASVSSGGSFYYQPAIGGCDQSTQFQCGVQTAPGNPPMVDLSENPGFSGDVTNGVQCLIGEGDPTDPPPNGQDTFDNYAAPSTYPFPILAGINNPVGLPNGTLTTNSNSIVSLPIYDEALALNPTGTSSVTIVGFLQVFINAVDPYGDLQVTVLNVAGCGNGSGGAVSSNPITGTSPVPIRLITPP